MSRRITSREFPKARVLACALAGCLFAAAPTAFAQSTAATVRGTVDAASGPAADAEVVATNTATGFVRRVRTDARGGYALAGLPPGTYRIDFSGAGASASRTIVLQVGQTATLNLPLEGGAPSAEAAQMDTITVTAQSLVETKTSEIATYVTQKQIEALPQINRNFLAFADTVPGVVFTQNTDGTTKLRGGAQNSNGVNVYIDGVGQKNYVLKGGITGQDGTRGNPFPQSAIAEYKVITQNYKAEYDQLSSVAITALTKSGSNQFHGDLFFDYTDQDWRQERPAERDGDGKVPTLEKQYGASLGGPIVKDTLFFFLSYEAKDVVTPAEITPGENVPVSDLPPEAQSLVGATSTPFNEDLYFGKLTWTPDESNLIEFTGRYRNEDQADGNTGVNTASFGTNKHQEEKRGDLRWQFTSGNWLNDAHVTFEDAIYEPQPIDSLGYGTRLLDYRSDGGNGRTVLNYGSGENFQRKGQKGWSIQDDLTWTGLEWGGYHTLKAGFKFKSIEITALEQQPYTPQYFFDVHGDWTVPTRVEFGVPVPGTNPNVVTTAKQFGIYLQDDWEVTPKLSLNLGLRWDYEKVPSYLDFEPRPELVAALRGWSNLDNADYDIDDYIGNGSNRKAFKDAWQPRLGFSYDLFEDQRHVIFGGAGRSYDRNLFDYLALERSKGSYPRYRFDFNAPTHPCEVGGTCLEWDPSYYDPANLAALVAANPNLGGEINLISNDLKTPYSDQFSFGMRNTVTAFGIDWNTSATLSYVASHDGIYFALGNRYPNGSFRENPDWIWGGQPWGHPIPGFGTLLIADNGIETRNKSILLSLEKPYSEDSPWSLSLAYTYNNPEENRLNAASTDEHYIFDYPNPDGQGFLRSLGIPRHRLVVTAVADGPWDMTYSVKATFASPVAKEATNCLDAASGNHCFFDPFTPEGSFGTKQVDISATKYWVLDEGLRLRFRADVLNLFNTYNWNDYDTWRGFVGDANPNFGSRNGPGLTTPTRTLKLSVGLSF